MTATITSIEVVPVAGHDSMLLNLSGAHGPFFTRNIAIVTDSDGREGVGEVPGGEAIKGTIEDAAAILVGQPVAKSGHSCARSPSGSRTATPAAAASRPSTCAQPSTR